MTTDPYAYPDEPFYAPGWGPPRTRREPAAVAALTTGILLLGPVPVVLGLLALRRTRVRGTRGRGAALAGLVLGTVSTIGWLTLTVTLLATSAATRPLAADLDAPRDAHATQLVTGSCVATLPSDGAVDHVREVPCDTEHAAQVITDYEFEAGAPWPGDDAVVARVTGACALNDAERDAGLRTVVWTPSERSWAQGDRTGLCLAGPEDGTMTGSLLDGTADLP